MSKELPGFYFDPEKNRYFPYKGPVPGSSSKPKPYQTSSTTTTLPPHSKQAEWVRQEKLLQTRELCGNILYSRKGKLSFRDSCEKMIASEPLIWKFRGTSKIANVALEHVVADIISPDGQVKQDILLSGGLNGLLYLLPIGKSGQDIDEALPYYKPSRVGSIKKEKLAKHNHRPRQLGAFNTSMRNLLSDISGIKLSSKHSLSTDVSTSKHFVITTMGSDSAPGSVYLLDLTNPLDFEAVSPLDMNGCRLFASFKQTLWTADCDPERGRAVIGTNRGAMLLNMETRVSSWVYRCKSDVMSLQLDQSGNSILCGLRNGSIVTVDTRQKQIKHSTPFSSMTSMPSSVCCLASLNLYNQYFLASSMDGTMRLYDCRLTGRGAVQSYEGNVNSHTRIQLGVDPSEKVVMSGGEDNNLRLWDIKSGKLLFNKNFMKSTPSAVCWPKIRGSLASQKDEFGDYKGYWEDHSCGAWLGSLEGIFYMDWL